MLRALLWPPAFSRAGRGWAWVRHLPPWPRVLHRLWGRGPLALRQLFQPAPPRQLEIQSAEALALRAAVRRAVALCGVAPRRGGVPNAAVQNASAQTGAVRCAAALAVTDHGAAGAVHAGGHRGGFPDGGGAPPRGGAGPGFLGGGAPRGGAP